MDKDRAARQYHRIKNRLFPTGIILNILALLFLFISGWSAFFKEMIQGINQQPLLVNACYSLGFSVYMALTGLPLSFYEGFALEHKFNLSNQSLGGWIKDSLKGFALSTLVIVIAIEALYIFLKKSPLHWWLWATGFWLFLTVVIARITPSLIIPLFFKYHKVDNQNLKEKIFSLLRNCRVRIKDIFYIDFSKKTKKANAFICGMGRSRRVVLTDTLLANFSPEEIKTVVAHELGNYQHRDILKLIAVNGAVTFLGFFLADKFLRSFLNLGFGASGIRIEDIGSLPFLALTMMIFGLAASPALNAFSRLLEVEADRFSIQLTKAPAQFISMMKKLGEMNLAEEDPGWFDVIMFYDHPPVKERIQFAQGFLPATG